MQTSRSKSVVSFLLFASCVSALGQQPKARSEENPGSPRTFAEARMLGRGRSTFRNRQIPDVTAIPKPNSDEFARSIKPILENVCVQCHGDETQEGNVRIDTFNPDLVHGDDIDWWLEVQAVLTGGEMPPPDEVELADADRAKIIEWLSNEIQVASIVRANRSANTIYLLM